MPIRNQFYLDGNGQMSQPAMLQAGPILQVEVHVPNALAAVLGSQGQTIAPPISGWALFDTGATVSAVHEATAVQLGVKPVGTVLCGTAGGQVQQKRYPVRFSFPAIGLDVPFNVATGVDLTGQTVEGHQIVALIGRDVLGSCVFSYNGPGGFFTLSW